MPIVILSRGNSELPFGNTDFKPGALPVFTGFMNFQIGDRQDFP